MSDENKLTNNQKAMILDKLIIHAKTIERGEWIEGELFAKMFAKKEIQEIKEHAIYFLKIVRKAMAEQLSKPSPSAGKGD